MAGERRRTDVSMTARPARGRAMPTPTASAASPPDITVEFARQAVEAVREVAASVVLPRFRTVTATRKDDGSLVTEADMAAQSALSRALLRVAPVPMLGEEMPEAAQRAILKGGGRFWCVDPIDGTANFSQGHPFFAVSVALVEGTRPVFGTVVDPIADEAFFATRAGGAWMNGLPLPPAEGEKSLADCVAEVSLRRRHPTLRHALKDRSPVARRLTSDSSALSWCHLAAGRIDLFLHAGQRPWDYAAGALIAEEAGARLATIESDDFWAAGAWDRSVVAARSPALARAWRDWVRARLAPGPPKPG